MSPSYEADIIDERFIKPTLIDLVPSLVSSFSDITAPDPVGQDKLSNGKWKLGLKIKKENVIVLTDRHCPKCSRHLRKNGKNERSVYGDDGKVKETYQLQRYICNHCGVINIDYSDIIKDGGKYGEKYPRIARLLFMLGLPPYRIQKVFIATNQISIPLSTIKSWIYPLRNEIRTVLYPRNMPFSGAVSYDEMYMKMEGKKEYFLGLVDCRTNIVIRSEIVGSLEKSEIKTIFKNVRREQNLVIKGAVMDGGNAGGNAFKDRSLKQIKRQRCHTHFKKTIRKMVYVDAGMGKQVKKALPKKIEKVLHAFYSVIDSRTEADFDERHKKAHNLIKKSKNPKLIKPWGMIRTSKQILLQYLKTPYLDNTTNKSEALHHEIEVYPSLKSGQKTEMGADLVSSGMIYIHNMRNTEANITKEENWDGFYNNKGVFFKNKYRNHSSSMKHRWFKKKLKDYRKGLEEFWSEYLPVPSLDLFKALWRAKNLNLT